MASLPDFPLPVLCTAVTNASICSRIDRAILRKLRPVGVARTPPLDRSKTVVPMEYSSWRMQRLSVDCRRSKTSAARRNFHAPLLPQHIADAEGRLSLLASKRRIFRVRIVSHAPPLAACGPGLHLKLIAAATRSLATIRPRLDWKRPRQGVLPCWLLPRRQRARPAPRAPGCASRQQCVCTPSF